MDDLPTGATAPDARRHRASDIDGSPTGLPSTLSSVGRNVLRQVITPAPDKFSTGRSR